MEPILRACDIIIFYRTADGGPDYYTSVITVLAVVENVVDNFTNFEEFKTVCRKRSVFTDEDLLTHLNYKSSKPFIINFLYAYYLPVRPNLKALKENNVIENVHVALKKYQMKHLKLYLGYQCRSKYCYQLSHNMQIKF